MEPERRTKIQLCGRMVVELAGRHVEERLPGRQGRLVFAYLALNRDRPVGRDELLDLLWPSNPPASPGDALSALLSKLRRALGASVLEGRRELNLALPEDAWIDLEAVLGSIERAEADLARSEWTTAWREGHAVVDTASRGFLAGQDADWVEERRREIEELRLRGLECIAAAGLGLGGSGVGGAERAARDLIESARLRETGYRFLMQALAARGNVAEALRVYDDLRLLLRDELGTSPGATVKDLHARLLAGEEEDDAAEPASARGTPAERAPAEPTGAAAALEEGRPEAGLPPEERKLVTILIAELTEGAPHDGERDPERLRAGLAPYEARIRAELERFGATVERLAAPTVVAIFGAPVAHEDDAERGARAALRLLEVVGELNQDAPEAEIAARAGVATGEALVAPRGRPTGGDGIASGEVLTTALRLQQAATVGRAVVDELTCQMTRHGVDYARLKPARIEGGGAPIPAWEARALRAVEATPATQTPFVGREHELELLESLQRTVVEEGRPRLVAILGEAGAGKSRLTDEFLRRNEATGSGAGTYGGRCLPYGEGIVYWPLREILWSAAGILLDDDGAAAAAKLRLLVGRVLGSSGDGVSEAERTMFAIAITAGITLADNPLERMSPESVAQEIGLAWPRFLSAVAAELPTIVVVEDLHWAEPALLDMVEHILSRSEGRLLLVATGRPEFADARPGWSSGRGMSQISLEPLTEAQSRRLLDELLPGVGPELRSEVTSAAEGNPFFAEEIVRHLLEEGVLEPGRDRLVEADSNSTIGIPNTVRALLAARVDRLPDAEKQTVQDAAVVGRTFWVTTLESMRADASLRERLRSLEERGLVVARPTSSLPGQEELWFRHALTREVAYQSVPRERRSKAHAEVGRWIEELTRDRREEFIDLLAYHYESAAAPEGADLAWSAESADREEIRVRAVEALLDGGRAAYRRSAADPGLRFAERALALARTDAERLAALELKARSLHAALRPGEALAAYAEALETAERLSDRKAITRLSAHAALMCSRYGGAFSGDAWKPQAAEIVERGLAAEGDGSMSFEAGALLVGRASTARWFDLGRDEKDRARQAGERALEIAETIESPHLLAHALEALYWRGSQEGFCESAKLGERMVQVVERIGDPVEEHETIVIASISFARAARFEDAIELAGEATSRAGRLSRHRRLHAACAQTICLVPTGRLTELLDATAGTAELIREEGRRTCAFGVLALAGQAHALFEAGDGSAAARTVQLLDMPELGRKASSFRYRAVEILRPFIGLEQSRLRLEAIEEPRDSADAIQKLRAELPLAALAGERDRLERLAREARALARPACAPPLAWLADWGEAVRLVSAGGGIEAVSKAREAALALEAYGEPYTAARLQVDLQSLLGPDAAPDMAEATSRRLESMGAYASAAEAQRGARSRS